jgi:protein SCO1
LDVPKIAYIMLALVGVVFAGSLGLLFAVARAQPKTPAAVAGESSDHHSTDPLVPDANAKDLFIPPFTLLDQDGRKVGNDLFTGRITIVDFYFTHCKSICPVLVQHMLDQARALMGTPVKLLSISVDPDHDTPAVIKAYAQEHGADPNRWTFTTGDRQTIGRIIELGLKFMVGDDPSPDRAIKLEDGASMNNIVHPSWFVLIGPKGEVLGFYPTDDEDELRALTQRARAAAAKLGR